MISRTVKDRARGEHNTILYIHRYANIILITCNNKRTEEREFLEYLIPID